MTWDDTTAVPGVTYYYRLRTTEAVTGSMNFSGSGYTSPLLSATVPGGIPAPTNLQVTVTSATDATFSFGDPSTNENGFDVELATAAVGPWSALFRLPANQTQGSLAQMTPGTSYWLRVRTAQGGAQSAPSNVVGFTTPVRRLLRATADTTVMKSTAVIANQDQRLTADYASVGCFFNATPVAGGSYALFHNCAVTLLQFNTSTLAGSTVVAAWLVMTPCALAPHPVADATYAAVALAGAWNPATVTYNTLPAAHSTGGWAVPAPTSAAASEWLVTDVVRNWVAGTWTNNGLYVMQYPIVDRRPFWGGMFYANQDQTTSYCSLEQNGGNLSVAPTLVVDTQ
ncbi:MAG: hypothetical protein AMXMBFR34_33080 [Myxococcaceae bacterium]